MKRFVSQEGLWKHYWLYSSVCHHMGFVTWLDIFLLLQLWFTASVANKIYTKLISLRFCIHQIAYRIHGAIRVVTRMHTVLRPIHKTNKWPQLSAVINPWMLLKLWSTFLYLPALSFFNGHNSGAALHRDTKLRVYRGESSTVSLPGKLVQHKFTHGIGFFTSACPTAAFIWVRGSTHYGWVQTCCLIEVPT